MSIVYEWDNEVQERDQNGVTIEYEHDHHETAADLIKAVRSEKDRTKEGFFNTPVLVRDVLDSGGSVTDRQWAYMVRGDSGEWYLPIYFQDAYEVDCAKVPAYLKEELRRAQA